MPDLDQIRAEFKRFAPSYAQAEAEEAFDKVVELQAQGLIRTGLFYVVLVDIVGSTKFMAEAGNDAAAQRIQLFVRAAIGSIGRIMLRNTAVFIKELGDAVLLLFQCFPDILEWHAALSTELVAIPEIIGGPKLEIRTCIHIGDVLLDGVNPISLAVSQLFKLEKEVLSGDIVLTEPAYFTAWPTVARAYHAFEQTKTVQMDGYPDPVPLYRLIVEIQPDAAGFVKEGDFDF